MIYTVDIGEGCKVTEWILEFGPDDYISIEKYHVSGDIDLMLVGDDNYSSVTFTKAELEELRETINEVLSTF